MTLSPNYIMDFALHTDIAGNKTVFALTSSSLTTNRALRYDSTDHILTGFQSNLPNSQVDVRFSWTQGEERTFVVRGSVIGAIYASSPGTFSVETLSSPAGLFLEYFGNRVFLMNVIGAANRVQWSARALYSDWATTTGHGGFLDLYDGTVDNITGGKVLNDRLVVYRNSSITDLVETGDDTAPFLPQGRAYGIGCLAPWTLCNAGQFHIFLANDYNVYVWDGSKLTPIGTPIHTYIREIVDQGLLNTWRYAPYGAMFMGFKEYHLVIPQQDGTHIVLIYDYLRDTWTRDVFYNLRALFEWSQTGLTGSPGYDGTGFPSVYPTMLASRDKDLFIIDERIDGDRLSRPADGGREMFFDTPDMFYDPESALANATLERVMISQGWPRFPVSMKYLLEISVDRGQTFTASHEVTPKQNHWGFEFVDTNLTSHVRRYRFRYVTANGPGRPSWRSYSEIYVPSGEYFPVDFQPIAGPQGVWDQAAWDRSGWDAASLVATGVKDVDN